MSAPLQIGRYRVLGLLGKGSMGVVYRGRDQTLDRDVALKVMALGPGADAEGRARFQREARAVARLQHPNIVTVYELGEHEGSPFMAMELLEGVDLQRAIEAGLRPDPKSTLPIVLQLLAGLGHAHENGIVHRDVKPSNIFLPRGRPAKIMDFGVARLAGGMTTTGQVVGTPNYMSPEQVRGVPVDGRSDVFSSGLILYELVTGEKAYRGDSVVALLFKIAHQDPDLSLIPRGLHWDRLRAILARALARDPAQRYADARAMAGELAQALDELGGSPDWAAASDQGLMVRTPRPSTIPDFDAPVEPSRAEPELPLHSFPVPTAADVPAIPAHPVLPERLPSRRIGPWIPAAVFAGAAALAMAAVALVLSRRGAGPSRPTAPPVEATRAVSSGVVPSVAATAPTAGPPSAPPARAPSPRSAPRPDSVPPPTRPPDAARDAARDAESEAASVAAGPAPADARLERANQRFESGRFAAALAEARAVLKREPGNAEAKELMEDAEIELVVEARLREARAALQKGDKESALTAAKAGLSVKPTDARLLALWREATQ